MRTGDPPADLTARQSHWLSADVLAWPWPLEERASYSLHGSAAGALSLGANGVTGADAVLRLRPGGALPPVVAERFRHLSGCAALRVEDADRRSVAALLRGQLAAAATADGALLQATGVQVPGVLDDLYAAAAEDADLGVSWHGGAPTLRLWAPTAQAVVLHRFPASRPPGEDPLADAVASTPMERDDASGIWSLVGEPGWDRQHYLFEVIVFQPATGRVEHNIVTDPCSRSLSTDSVRSQIVDLRDPALRPAGWDDLAKPAFDGFPAVYELHLRDFSSGDPTVPAEHVGTYLAFTADDSAGVRHLRALAAAGMTHLHLLPLNDIATIPEDPADRVTPRIDRPDDPASGEPQRLQQATRDRQAFSWGYDPFHFFVPEGSYATDPDGPARIVELRRMVAALNGMGLRLVLDVVYNHTYAAGQDAGSVLDRVVPGYYHRLDERGETAMSTCCPGTASEHRMMAKLLVDSVVGWARDHKVDGFRFDLMGHHRKADLLAVRAALDALTVAEDGVDGASIVLYGEGWDFGEVAGDRRFEQATQRNMAGTRIATFDDRLRDAVRGGAPFSGLREQGWATGLATAPNDAEQRSPQQQRDDALHQQLWVQLGLAGNLRGFVLETPRGEARRGSEIPYGGAPAGYAEHPLDHLVYVSKHDNETLFDAIQLKAPAELPMEERVRMQVLALSTVAFSQGVAFFHAGSDLLRSKSLDRNSFRSGDHFNRIDWTRQTSGFGMGLPPAAENAASWPVQREVLRSRPVPRPEHIGRTAELFQELLRIRAGHAAFRMSSAEEIAARLRFHADGRDAEPGRIVLELRGTAGEDDLLIVFNARPEPVTVPAGTVASRRWRLHPVQQASADARVRTAAFAGRAFTVPARTTAVFVAAPAPEAGGRRSRAGRVWTALNAVVRRLSRRRGTRGRPPRPHARATGGTAARCPPSPMSLPVSRSRRP